MIPRRLQKLEKKIGKRLTMRMRKVLQRKKLTAIDAIIFIIYSLHYITASSLVNIRNKSSVVHRTPFSFANHSGELTDEIFTRLYRVTKHQFNLLRELTRTKVHRKQQIQCLLFPAVSAEVMMAITYGYYLLLVT